MFSISKAKTANSARKYYQNDYRGKAESYGHDNSQSKEKALGEWQGIAAEEIGLKGAINAANYESLLWGKHPITGKQLIVKRGERTVFIKGQLKHQKDRAGWDGCFSCPKSVSLQAIIGGDQRVEQAHKKAVLLALKELEKFTQARMGGNKAAESTNKFV